ncbi:MAG: AAA family ATPase [Candidatus Aminicenantes bacterium]|nr:AAA family ATPase [Candidatus Aminicenantes bacterium]
MKISKISISKYRAFDQKVTFPLSELTVLTGPNNLGKSTILNSLNLIFGSARRNMQYRYISKKVYNYTDDYPKRFQGHRGRRWPTRFEVSLDFTETDKQKALRDINIELPNSAELGVEFQQIDSREAPFFSYYEILWLSSDHDREKFIKWIRERVRYIYIPATRNIEDFKRTIFSELISGAIHRVSRSRQKIKLFEKFYSDIQSHLASVERTLVDELKRFLPSVNSIKFGIEPLDLEQLVNLNDVEIHDGALTSLLQKGDGFKSLFVISMLQFIAKQQFGQNLIFGIEEPEAHLHPSAIYQIKETLRHLSSSFQTIITTHSPIMIQRDKLNSNIIVQQKSDGEFASIATPAKKLSEIRQALGIKPQDNMTTAEVVLVVEGLTEERCFGYLLKKVIPELGESLDSGRIRILSANGASNVIAVVRALARDAANSIVFFDSDNEGNMAYKSILSSGLIDPADIFHVPPRLGCLETEFEDLFLPEIYIDAVSVRCGLDINSKVFEEARKKSGVHQTKAKKWSQVMSSLVLNCGKDWNVICDVAKETFSDSIIKQISAIDISNFIWLKSIGIRIKDYLSENNSGKSKARLRKL